MGSVLTHASNTPKGFGKNVFTVGDGGDFATVTAAVNHINSLSRYTVVYDTGTVTLTQYTKKATPSGGADFSTFGTATTAKEYWIYLDTALVWLPLQGISPPLATATPATSWGDYAELKYDYLGATGAKSYQLCTPNWCHIVLLAGETYDDTNVDWPLFTTISGISKEASIFRGSIHIDASAPGIWMDNFSWSSITGVKQLGEEALITVDDTVQNAEPGYADIVMLDVVGGRGNADRDVTYRTTTMVTHGLFKSIGCSYYSHYDAIQCTARNLIFRDNDVHIHTQDTTIYDPTGLRWFSSSAATVGSTLYTDISHNEFYVKATAGARVAVGLVLLPDNVGYISTSPKLYGQILDNYIEVIQNGTGNATGIQTPEADALWAGTDSRLLVDRNTFNVVSAGGTKKDIATNGATTPTKAITVWGKNNRTYDGSALVATGYLRGSDPINALTGTVAISQTLSNGENYITGTAAATYTLPEATGTGQRYRFIIGEVNTNGTVFVVADTTNTNFIGSVNNLDLDGSAQAAFGCPANCDTITLNGTTTGGAKGDWLEFVDVATDVWMVTGQLQCPTGSNPATPFSAAV